MRLLTARRAARVVAALLAACALAPTLSSSAVHASPAPQAVYSATSMLVLANNLIEQRLRLDPRATLSKLDSEPPHVPDSAQRLGQIDITSSADPTSAQSLTYITPSGAIRTADSLLYEGVETTHDPDGSLRADLRFVDANTGLRAVRSFRLSPNVAAITRTMVLENAGPTPLRITRLESLALHAPTVLT